MATRARPLARDELRSTCRAMVFRVGTLADIDANIAGLYEWLGEQLQSAPEHGYTYFLRYRRDVDALLDRRLVLMAERDAAVAA